VPAIVEVVAIAGTEAEAAEVEVIAAETEAEVEA
jgi:hypothetical protein